MSPVPMMAKVTGDELAMLVNVIDGCNTTETRSSSSTLFVVQLRYLLHFMLGRSGSRHGKCSSFKSRRQLPMLNVEPWLKHELLLHHRHQLLGSKPLAKLVT